MSVAPRVSVTVRRPPESQGKPSIRILLAGTSGIPGRNILSSLLAMQTAESARMDVQISVLKRGSTSATTEKAKEPRNFETVYVDDFANIGALSQAVFSFGPHIVISALNAEPSPILDNYLIDSITGPASRRSADTAPMFFINGFTLDLLHPSVATSMPASALQTIAPKIDFAHRLRALSHSGQIEYCTVVCSAFLDYCLMKGYSGIDVGAKKATLVDEGKNVVTGCSLSFVGEAVAQIVRQYVLGSNLEKSDVSNKRLRIAETDYSGRRLLDVVQQVTGDTYEVQEKSSNDLLKTGSVIGYLNWNGNGASSLLPDGLEFGSFTQLNAKRRSLEEIVRTAITNGVDSFEGIGR